MEKWSEKTVLNSAGTSARHHRYVVAPIRHRQNCLGNKCRGKGKKEKWELVDCKLNTGGNAIQEKNKPKAERM